MYFYDAATILRQVNSKIVKVADFFFLLAVDHDFALLCVGLHAKSLCILNQYVVNVLRLSLLPATRSMCFIYL